MKKFSLFLFGFLILTLLGSGRADAKKKHRRHHHHRSVSPCSASEREANRLIVRRVAIEEGVDPAMLEYVAKCESTFCNRAVGDGGQSIGTMQIKPKYHPLTKEECRDTEKAARYAAREIKAGRGRAWTCYRKWLKGPRRPR